MPKIGSWYAGCCMEDLSQFETQDEIDEIMEHEEEIPGSYMFFDTYDDAKRNLQGPH